MQAEVCVDYSRQMVGVFSTDDFDRRLRKLKDREGRLRILSRIDRLGPRQPW